MKICICSVVDSVECMFLHQVLSRRLSFLCECQASRAIAAFKEQQPAEQGWRNRGAGGLGADACPYFGRSNNLISIREQILSPPPIFRISTIPASSRIKQESMAPMLNNYWTLASCTALYTTTDYGQPVRKLTSLHGRKSTIPNPKFLGTAEGYFVCHIGPGFFGCP